jgi:glucose-6-phosphate isomerase
MPLKYSVDENSNLLDTWIKKLKDENIIERIWKKDYTVWSSDPTEISNRLGWLDSPFVTRKSLNEIYEFVEDVKLAGFTNALLMGMGGSSLAPEVFRLTFGVKDGYLDLSVLDSTNPQVVLNYAKKFNPEKTLYIVSTKSGGTVETFSFMKFFYNYALHVLGSEEVGKHFIAITDPGSGLQKAAEELNFRKIFLNDPNIGGRFSALSLFGIVPAALAGVDVDKILASAEDGIVHSKKSGKDIYENTSALIGLLMGIYAAQKKDKLTFILSPRVKYFGAWAEQLIAESTGKIGKGILPVDLESIESPEFYSNDRLFVYIKLKGDNTYDDKAAKLKSASFPFLELELELLTDIGKEFLSWEFATAIAGWIMQIQPYDQPNVESAKIVARQMMNEYQASGKLPEPLPTINENGIKVFGNVKTKSVENVLDSFLENCKGGENYVTIQAYLNTDEKTNEALQKLRTSIQKKYKVATTLGLGPRFLHSTGQLHKGDGGNGYFIQFISDVVDDLPIPDNAGDEKSSITFGVLIKAQALGDRQALLDNNREVITIDLGESGVAGIKKLF